jgi:16S rRNA G966 N2-methylase RsmD
LDSSNELNAFITKCYQDILLREPDKVGLEYHYNKIIKKEILKEDIPKILRESLEYKNLSGNEKNLDNAIRTKITKCYREILFREPDILGLEQHLQKIKKREISINELDNIFKQSEEYKKIANKKKILKNKKKISIKKNKEKNKINTVKYKNLVVYYTKELDGGGKVFGQDFIPVVKKKFPKASRICEVCSGPGFIGFSLLANGLCDTLCLIDVNPKAIEICKKTISKNHLEDKVKVYLSDGLSNIPPNEKWDLLVSNPPHFEYDFGTTKEEFLIAVDPEWKMHREIYKDVGNYLSKNGSILFYENIEGSKPHIFSEMILENNLELVECFWHKKFNSLRDSKFFFEKEKEFGQIAYYKKILKEMINPSPYRFYFIWSKKRVSFK